MKYIVVLGDGMADRPLPLLGGRTPLEVAKKPSMDFMARNGRSGLLKNLPHDMPYGSDIANLSVLGYDPKKYYPGGRGPIEAAAMGIRLSDGDIAFRCNLITEEKGKLKDYSGGHVSTPEAEELIKEIDKELGNDTMRFYPGVGYRHIMVLKNPGISYGDLTEQPPHDIASQSIDANLIKAVSKEAGPVAESLNKAMLASKKILTPHPVNAVRVREGKGPANMIWLWGGGEKPCLPDFRKKYGLRGAMISAVDLLRGLAACTGLDYIEVPGATGYFDTDYSAKAEHAIKALDKYDLVYVHIEAPDEAGHEGNVKEKIRAIEEIDKKIVSPIMEECRGTDYTLAVLPDHATPIAVRTHTDEPVPFVIYSPAMRGDGIESYSEKNAVCGSYGLVEGPVFMDLLLGKKRKVKENKKD